MISLRRTHGRHWQPNLRAARHFQSLSDKFSDPKPLVSMFTQDVASGIVSYQASEGSGLEAKIIAPEADVRRAVSILKSVERFRSHGITELVTNAVRGIGEELSWHGIAPYEIWERTGIDADDNDDADEQPLGLSWFSPKNLLCLPKFCIQLVPRAEQKELGRKIIVLPKRILWLISMPRELGGYRAYRKILTRLGRFNWTAPSFWREDLENGRPQATTTFDFTTYRRRLDIYQNRATRKWGWNGRDTGTGKRTEFALFYRFMTFQWAQAVLREHIVGELNLLFKRLDIKAQIEIAGLSTPDKILKVREAMMAGTISYSKAYDEVKI